MITVHDVEQGSPEWFACRLGLPTASMFDAVLATGRGGGESKTRRTYLLKLAGEVLTGEPTEAYSNPYLERGKAMEEAARESYAFKRDAEPALVGFISNDAICAGCSPDALVGESGMLEIKTKAAHLHIEALLRPDASPEHRAQCQGQLWVAEREWVDLAIYWPKLPLVVHRIHRDEGYIRELAAAVEAFNAELAQLVERVRRYGQDAARAA